MRHASNPRRATSGHLCALSLFAVLAAPTQAGVLSGTVTAADGTPIAGAIVSVTDAQGRSQAVYSLEDGTYRLDTGLSGALDVLGRKRYYEDAHATLELGADASASRDFTLAAITDPKALSDAHPALSHFSMMAFDEDPKALFSRPNFARDCLTCHQLGNAFTRWQRPAESWVPTVQRMHGYLGDASEEDIRARSEFLARSFDGRLATSRPTVPYDPMLAQATIYRWSLEDAVVPHDAEFDEENHRIYISEMFAGELLEVNLDSGEVKHMKLPDDGMPPGGMFAKMGLPSPYGLTISRSPHSLTKGHDGRWYLSDSIGAAITAFDPKTGEFQNYDMEKGSLYPHTIRTGLDGRIWFSITFSDQIGRFDPKTGEMTVIDLPKTPSLSTPGTTVPYGVAIHPETGDIWYAKLASDKIGHIDPETLEVTEYDSPVRAPRRQRFDKQGYLWVAGFSDGAIARIDTRTMDAKVIPLPVFAEGEIPAPYALAVHPDTQDIWINDTMNDVAWRYIQAEERFVVYPLVLRGTYTRDFTFTHKGWACTASNPIPPAALEGGVPELICIDGGSAGAVASR